MTAAVNPAIKTAIVGFGFSAKTFHLPFLLQLPQFELCAISSSQGDVVTAAHPEAQVFADPVTMFHQSGAELVIITAPNDVHFSLAKAAIEAGLNVVLEKPFVTDVSQGEALIALAKQHQRVLSVYQNRRWDGDFLTVKKLLQNGELGQVRYFESHFDRFRPEVRQRWREQAADGGGILFDLGPHLIDQVLQLFGLPQAISADCHAWRKGSNNVDFFKLNLHYPKTLVNLQASLFCAAPNYRFQVLGDQGNYCQWGLDPQEDQLKAGLTPADANWAQYTADEYGTLYRADDSQTITTERGGYEHYYQQLAAAIRDGADVPVSAEDALWNIRLIEMAMLSSTSGQRLEVNG